MGRCRSLSLLKLFLLFFLVVHCAPCWILVPQPEIEPVVPCIGITKSYPLDHQGSPQLFVWYAAYLEPVSFFFPLSWIRSEHTVEGGFRGCWLGGRQPVFLHPEFPLGCAIRCGHGGRWLDGLNILCLLQWRWLTLCLHHQQCTRVSSEPHQHLFSLVFLMVAILTGVRWCLIVILICISLMI